MRRRLLIAVGLVATAAIVVALHSALATSPTRGRTTAAGQVVVQVARRDLQTTVNEAATLGYGDQRKLSLPRAQGVVTALPPLGAVIRRGQALMRIDDRPLTLFYGGVPAWRMLERGVSGVDVFELEANLHALGFDRVDPLTVDGHWTYATTAAVERWQRALGESATGVVGVDDVAFLPGPRRVAAVASEVGSLATGALLTTTSTMPEANVALDPADRASARRGTRVDVTVPNGRSLRGVVTAVGALLTPSDTNATNVGSAPAGIAGASSSSGTTIPVTVRLLGRALARLDGAPATATITTGVARHVLSVPVTALLALSNGGYGLELATSHEIIDVTAGVYADGFVTVAGRGIHSGLRVLAASS